MIRLPTDVPPHEWRDEYGWPYTANDGGDAPRVRLGKRRRGARCQRIMLELEVPFTGEPKGLDGGRSEWLELGCISREKRWHDDWGEWGPWEMEPALAAAAPRPISDDCWALPASSGGLLAEVIYRIWMNRE